MAIIDLRLLVEQEEDAEKPETTGEKISDVRYLNSPSTGTPTKNIRDAESRAVAEPEELLKDLGIKSMSGSTPWKQMHSALSQAVASNDVFGKAFSQPSIAKIDNDNQVVVIRPKIGVSDHPARYVGAIMLALQNADKFPKDLNPDPRSRAGSRRVIRQANDGRVIIAPSTWHRDIVKKSREEKEAQAKQEED